jgi:hypothetical protein
MCLFSKKQSEKRHFTVFIFYRKGIIKKKVKNAKKKIVLALDNADKKAYNYN